MAKTSASIIFAVLNKDISSEYRTRYALSSVLLFILITITMIVFAIADTAIGSSVAAAILWIVMFFTAMTGLSKSFVSEEERGTGLLLYLSAGSTSIYFGKLFFNIIMSLLLNSAAVTLFLIFLEIPIKYPLIFAVTIFLGSLGIAASTTIISAIIAKASSRNALFPILSFPLLLPLIIVGIETTIYAFDGSGKDITSGNFQLMTAYSGIVITASWLLFDFVWSE